MRYEVRETISNRLIMKYNGNQRRMVESFTDGVYRFAVDTKGGQHYDGSTWKAGLRPDDIKPSWSA